MSDGGWRMANTVREVRVRVKERFRRITLSAHNPLGQ